MTTEQIETAATAHAKEILGEKQFNDPTFETAKDSIINDFSAGVEWYKEQTADERLAYSTDKNMEIVSKFTEHLNQNFAIAIPDEFIESFFNA